MIYIILKKNTQQYVYRHVHCCHLAIGCRSFVVATFAALIDVQCTFANLLIAYLFNINTKFI